MVASPASAHLMLPRKATIQLNGFTIRVWVLNQRTNYSHLQYLVRPTDGLGEAWIAASKVSLE